MDNQGELTKSGLLYEGNYQEWEDRLMIMLKLLGSDSDRSYRLENGVHITHLIKSLVIPRLFLLSMPRRGKAPRRPQWRHLLNCLKLTAVPFRLMELPIDVRTRIWKFAIASQQGLIKYSITADSPFGDERLHPLTRVTREVRAETLALAWSGIRLEFKPSVSAIRLYKGEQFSSRYASRFHQLDAFERSNRVSRILPFHASFAIHEKKHIGSCKILMLMISRSSPEKWEICLKESGDAPGLAPSTMRRIQRHLDLASHLFSSIRSSTPLVMMAVLGAPSLWKQSNLECEWKPTKSTFRRKPRTADGHDPRMYRPDSYAAVLRESFNDL